MTSLHTVKWGLAAESKKIDRPKHGPNKETINTLINLKYKDRTLSNIGKNISRGQIYFLKHYLSNAGDQNTCYDGRQKKLKKKDAILEKLPKDLQRKLHVRIHTEIEPRDYHTEDRIGAIQRRKQQNGLNK